MPIILSQERLDATEIICDFDGICSYVAGGIVCLFFVYIYIFDSNASCGSVSCLIFQVFFHCMVWSRVSQCAIAWTRLSIAWTRQSKAWTRLSIAWKFSTKEHFVSLVHCCMEPINGSIAWCFSC